MVTPGPYPDQAYFLPEHLIIPFITLVIFTIILYVLSLVVKKDPTIKNSRKETEDKFNALNDDIKTEGLQIQ
jgi:hypothetical protein